MKKEDTEKTLPSFPKNREEVGGYIREVVEHLNHTGMMSAIDPLPISILGVQLGIFADAAEGLQAEGMIVDNGRGKLVPNPRIAVMNQAEVMALKIMKEYGLLPKSRKELGKGAEPKRDSPLGDFLKKKK